MSYSVIHKGYRFADIKEGEAPFLMGRVTTKARVAIVAANISTVKATVVNITTGTTVLNESSLTVGTVWFDTYQTGAEWSDEDGVAIDATGYNFGWQTSATYFTTTASNESQHFRVEIWVTPTSGEPFQAGWWEIVATPSIVPIAV